MSVVKVADQLARQGSSQSLPGLQPALGMSVKVARGVIRGWKNRSIGSPYLDKGKLRAVLKNCLLKGHGNYST